MSPISRSRKGRVDGLSWNFPRVQTMRLAVSRRTLIKDAVLIKIQPNSAKRPLERHFFLFNDMLLYTSAKKGTKNQYKYKGDIPTEVILLNNVDEAAGNAPHRGVDAMASCQSRDMTDAERMHGFELVRMDIPGKLYWLYASSGEEKAEWMAAIMSVVNKSDAEQRSAHLRSYEQYIKSTFLPEWRHDDL